MSSEHKGFALPFLLCLSLLAGGCSDEGVPLEPGVALISGSWVWLRSQGGFTGGIIFPQAGSKYTVTYSMYGEYSSFANGTLSLTARYKMRHEGEYLVVEYSDIHTAGGGYIDGTLFPQYVTVDRDTLRLRDFGADTYQYIYARLR